MNINRKLSPHFKLSEFIITETGMDNRPPESLLSRLTWIATQLEHIRSTWCKPIYVTSCYRSPKVNKAVGGSPTSLHLTAMAVDFRISNYSVSQLPALFKSILDTKPYELYPIDRNTLHVSWRPMYDNFEIDTDPFIGVDSQPFK